MSDKNPLVTVYIPTFNRVDLLKRAVESVRNQTYTNLEIIIVDDCSTDNTHEYLREISDLDQRIRYFIKGKNSGACVSRNIAIDNATGEYITGLDDDDYFLDNRIELFIRNKKLLSKYSFLYTEYTYEMDSKFISKKLYFIISPKKITLEHIVYINFVGNQIFTYTERLKNIGGFDNSIKAWQDMDTWYRMLENYGKAIKLNISNYVMDINDRTRITTSCSDKIVNTYEYFSKKNNLNEKSKSILRGQLSGYGKSVKVSDLLKFDIKFIFRIWFYYRLFSILKNIYLKKD